MIEANKMGQLTVQGNASAFGATELAAPMTSVPVSTIGVGYLSPEGLLAYCAMKMRGLDTQVDEIFRRQQERNRQSEALTELSRLVGVQSPGFDSDQTCKALAAAYERAIAQVGPNTVVGRRLAQELHNFRVTAQDDCLAPEEVSSFVNNLSSIQKSLNQDGELEMIQLQSLMSQRQQAIQMCTNMVQALGQSAQSVAGNIGK